MPLEMTEQSPATPLRDRQAIAVSSSIIYDPLDELPEGAYAGRVGESEGEGIVRLVSGWWRGKGSRDPGGGRSPRTCFEAAGSPRRVWMAERCVQCLPEHLKEGDRVIL